MYYWLEIAICEIELFHFDEAKTIYQRVLNWSGRHAPAHDSLLAWAYSDLGYIHGRLSQYPEQLTAYQEALRLEQKVFGEIHAKTGAAYNNLGTAYGGVHNYAKQLECYHKALAIRKATIGPNHAKVGATLNNIGYCYGRMGEYEKELDYYTQGLEIRKADLGEDHPRVGRSYNNIGFSLESTGRYEEAIKYFHLALDIMRKHYGDEHPNVASIFQNLGPCLSNLGEYDLAIRYSEKALNIYRNYYGEESENVIFTLNNLASDYSRMGEYAKAIELYLQSIASRRKVFGEESLEVSQAYMNLAVTHSLNGDSEKAIALNRKALKIRNKMVAPDHPEVIAVLSNLGAELAIVDSLDEAKRVLLEVINQSNKVGESNRNLINTWLYMAQVLTKQKQLDSAMLYIQKALMYEIPEMREKRWDEPVPEELLDKSTFVLNILERKALTISQLGESVLQLETANMMFNQAAISLDKLRMRMGTLSKRVLRNEMEALFQAWLTNNHRLFELTGDQVYLRQAWEVASRSSAFILREQLYKQKERSFAGLPDSLIAKERLIQRNIAKLKSSTQQFAQSTKSIDSIKVQRWQSRLLELEEHQAALIALYKTTYPHYYKEKYSLAPPSLKRLKQKLAENQLAFIQYFRSEKGLFMFYLEEKDLSVYRIDWDKELAERLSRYTAYFQKAHWNDTERRLFCEDAHQLYVRLIGPFEERLKKDQRLVIIPDQYLGYIPFETLLVSPPA